MAAMKKAAKSASSVFLQRGDSAPAEGPAPAAAAAARTRRTGCRRRAEAPLAVPDLAERAGMAPTALVEGLRPLEDLRLVRRLEPEDPDGAIRFAPTAGGRALLAKTAAS